MSTPGWYLDEGAHVGLEHLDSHYVAAYDAKTRLGLDAALDLLRRAGLGPDTTPVDLGCGTGLLAVAAAASARRVVGVDPSPPMLEAGRGRSVALHHLPDFWKGIALARIHDLLAPGGTLVLRVCRRS